MSEFSAKPFLIDALYRWCIETGLTPYLTAILKSSYRSEDDWDGSAGGDSSEVTFDLGSESSGGVVIDGQEVRFTTVMAGEKMAVVISHSQIVAFYAKETGYGLFFSQSMPPGNELVCEEGSFPVSDGAPLARPMAPRRSPGRLKVLNPLRRV